MYKQQQKSWLDEHKGVLILSAIFLAALAFGGWGAWQVFGPVSGDPRSQLASARREGARLQDEIEQLHQRVTTLTRSDQISRDANRDLQGTLADRDEEIAGLRADVAFYERLVGATAQRRGLSVHALRMQPQNGTAWHFTATLTQNLNRGAVSDGRADADDRRHARRQAAEAGLGRPAPAARARRAWRIRSSTSSRSRATCSCPPASRR